MKSSPNSIFNGVPSRSKALSKITLLRGGDAKENLGDGAGDDRPEFN